MKVLIDPTKYQKYAFEYEFSMELLEFCRYVKSKVGQQEFNFSEKKWRFNNIAILDIIRSRYPQVEIDDSMADDWKAYLIKQAGVELKAKKANKLKSKTTSDLVIKGIKGELYPYQKIGVEFFINNHGKAILADTMGLGKTAQALAYIVHQKLARTLVVCPASVKFVWEEETKKWTSLKPFVFSAQTFRSKPGIELIKEYDIFIINYDILSRFVETYSDIRWDCLVLDEFHYIKNSTAKRTKIAKAVARKIPSVLLLSGTPLLSRPVELFNGLQIMDPIIWKNWKSYTEKYCQGHETRWGWDCRGASNIPELQEKISHYFLRRRKEDVLPELPPKQLVNIPVELSPESRFEYDLILSSFKEYLRDVKGKNLAEIRKTMQAEKLVRLGALRQITTNGKIKAAEEIIQNIVDGDEKVIVFSCYNQPLKDLEKKFKDNSVLILGGTEGLLRKKMIEAFQKNPKVKVFLGGIKSTGIGITLTAASNVLFLDYSWTPADHDQAEDRAHRPGQTAESLTIYKLYAKNSIDEFMKQLLEKKKLLFNQLMDEPTTKKTSVNIIDDLVKEIQKDY